MGFTLHLGVIDVPYSNPTKPKKVAAPKKRLRKGRKAEQPTGHDARTTGEVARILEDKYHIMESFFYMQEEAILKRIADGVIGAVESVMMGAPPTIDPFGTATSEIKNQFSKFLTEGGVEKVGIPGVPTAASGKTSKRKGGINHRLKHPYSQNNPSRPSFIDTGQYEATFRAWVDGD